MLASIADEFEGYEHLPCSLMYLMLYLTVFGSLSLFLNVQEFTEKRGEK